MSDDDFGKRVKGDFMGLAKGLARFADGGLVGLFGGEPEPAEAPPAAAATAPSHAAPRTVDVAAVVEGACSFCAGTGRVNVTGGDGRVRAVRCPDCGGT